MIKDLIVNLAVGMERDPARDYALTIAEAFDAHLVDPMGSGWRPAYWQNEVA